jgi:hypothetical protein
VELLDAEGGGARFVVTLPLALVSEVADQQSVTRTAP